MDINEFSRRLCASFHLKAMSSRIFAHLNDCVIVGLVLVKVPVMPSYKLYFAMYPLWRSSLKECLDIPLFQIALLDDKGFEIYLPKDIDDEYAQSLIEKCREQFPLLSGDISFANMIISLNSHIAHDKSINSNFVLNMKIYKLIYGVALYKNELEAANNIYHLISRQISQWDADIFRYWYGEKEDYLRTLKEYAQNRELIIGNVQSNLSNPKIARTDRFKMTY